MANGRQGTWFRFEPLMFIFEEWSTAKKEGLIGLRGREKESP
jgi:hypothetical protein